MMALFPLRDEIKQNETIVILGHDSALWGYTGPGTTADNLDKTSPRRNTHVKRQAIVVSALSDPHGGQHAGVAQLAENVVVVEAARGLVHVGLDAAHKQRVGLVERLHEAL